MPRLIPDQSFYASPTTAMDAPREQLAYVAMLNPDPSRPDAIGVVDLDPGASTYGQLVHRLDMPVIGTVRQPADGILSLTARRVQLDHW